MTPTSLAARTGLGAVAAALFLYFTTASAPDGSLREALRPSGEQGGPTTVLSESGATDEMVPGSEARYAFDYTEATELLFGQGAERERGERHIRGELRCGVVELEDGELGWAISLDDLVLSVPSMPSEDEGEGELVADLARPFLARLAPDGDLIGFRFRETTPGEVRDLQRVLAFGLRFVRDEGAGTRASWTSDEVDVTGPYTARYSWVSDEEEGLRSVVVVKERGAEATGGRELATAEARTEAVLPVRSGWPRRVSASEALTAALPEVDGSIEVEHRLELELLHHGTSTRQELVWAEGPWSSPSGVEELGSTPGDEPPLEPLDFEEVLARLAALSDGEGLDPAVRFALLEEVAEHIAADPAFLADVQAALERSDLPEDSASLLAAALGAAGTPEAAAVLASLASDPLQETPRRVVGVVALGSIPEFSPGTHSLLGDLMARDDVDPRLRGSATLALGSILRAGAGDPARRRTAEDLLLAQEAEALRRGELGAWFEALANADTRRALEALTPYLRDPAPKRRRAAARALARMRVEGSLDLLVERAAKESLADVRLPLCQGLALRPEEAALEATRTRLLREVNEHVRVGMVRSLVRRLARDEKIEPVLAELAGRDPSERVRELAAEGVRWSREERPGWGR